MEEIQGLQTSKSEDKRKKSSNKYTIAVLANSLSSNLNYFVLTWKSSSSSKQTLSELMSRQLFSESKKPWLQNARVLINYYWFRKSIEKDLKVNKKATANAGINKFYVMFYYYLSLMLIYFLFDKELLIQIDKNGQEWTRSGNYLIRTEN